MQLMLHQSMVQIILHWLMLLMQQMQEIQLLYYKIGVVVELKLIVVIKTDL